MAGEPPSRIRGGVALAA